MTSYKEVGSFKTFQEVMARSLTNNPYAIYLFEEIDKAAVEVLDQLYFMMDEGIFYDQHQRPLFARGAFLIFTTNAASDTILNNPKAPELRKMVMAELQKSFRMSFLNRFDAISIFLPFTQEEYVKLAKTLADKKISKIKEYYDWTVTLDQGTYNYIATHGQSAVFGMGAGIAEYQLNKGNIPDLAKLDFKKLSGDHDFRLSVNGDKIDYVVNPGNNSVRAPMLLRSQNKKGKVDLESFFASIRMYED
jgi:ATP-dependent Clp protease ATP-binding subunit ClpA